MTGIFLMLWILRKVFPVPGEGDEERERGTPGTSLSPSRSSTDLQPTAMHVLETNTIFSHSDDQPTTTQLALLASRFPHLDTPTLNDVLMANGCCADVAAEFFGGL
ncbi:hypothetical protein BKA65DRAFT_474423 [Rhexocercosporidium sp. MPI-PUGE-AT-0058]|nr:hypothetical protein BKA65DRAFT_474423 [Rhexocercosporidium sp. MPI-PUGE-AT-0058]